MGIIAKHILAIGAGKGGVEKSTLTVNLAVALAEKGFLLVDLPPGIGDVPLSLKQMLPLTGALLVTTPQEVALRDVIKAID